MVVSLNFLGGFAAFEASGRPLSFPTVKAEALLAFLVLRGSQGHYRDKLSGLLWGAASEVNARASLRQALLRVRKAWPSDEACCLLVDGKTVAIDNSTVTVDVERFERCAGESTPESWEMAASLYRGDLLDGLLINEPDFDDWLITERRRLQELALSVLRRLLDHYTATGAIERGIRVANRLLLFDPYQEAVQRTLMRFYLHQERRAAALAQYQQFSEILRREIGAEPEPETQAVYRQLLDGAPVPEPPKDVEAGVPLEPPRPSPKPTSPMRDLSIAVLPFENLDGDPDQKYLCDGIAEDIITGLTRFPELYVIARNSSFAYRNSCAEPQQIGRLLGVSYLLEGSFRRQGDSSRLTAKLVEADSGHQIWAEQYATPLADLFTVQDEISRRIVVTLVDRIAAERLKSARRKPPGSWRAYDHWLQGMSFLRRVDMDSLALARAAFHRAIETEPGYARAYAGMAMTYYHAWSCFAWNAWANLEGQAYDYARKAVDLDETDHQAHCILATAFIIKRQYQRAERHIDRALTLNPNDANTLANAALVWSFLGEPKSAVAAAETAVRLDPHYPDWYTALLGLAYYVARDYPSAISAMSLEPDAMCDTRAYLAAACAWDGDRDEADQHAQAFLRYCTERLGGDPASDIGRYMDWVIRANVYRREDDAQHFIEGLRKAGLPA